MKTSLILLAAWLPLLLVRGLGQGTPAPRNFTAGADAAAKFGVHEIVLTGDGGVANPFDTIATVTFTPPSGAAKAKTVHAFFDGGGTWRARVYVGEPGEWKWSSRCATDTGLNGKHGSFAAADSKLRGRLLSHPKNPRQWMTEDGRWFLNLNDTAYFLLCAHDASGAPISDEQARQYVRDNVARGITSVRCSVASRAAGYVQSREQWIAWHFADDSLDRLRMENLQCADRRLRMLLDEFPDVAVQLILFPLEGYGRDDRFWAELSAAQRERLLRNIVARFAAYPQLFWLVVNDAHYGEKYPNHNALARETGAYLQRHDPWQHPRSTGYARNRPFLFGAEDWATYIHIEHAHDLGAAEIERYRAIPKPVFLGEDRYEQDHGPRRDPAHMDYWQRRLFWAWLIAGGSANYGGRWWCVQPYDQMGKRPTEQTVKPTSPPRFTAPLTGLDSVVHIRDYFTQRRIELSGFEPDDARVKDAAGATGIRAPKLARRAQNEFLIYHPHADPSLDNQHTRPIADHAAGFAVDLRDATGSFAVEWYRAADGAAQAGEPVAAGDWRQLTAPWKGHDCIARLLQRDAASAQVDVQQAERKTYTYKTVGDLAIKADVFRLPGDDVRPVIVWIHGGGLITGGRGGPALEQRQRYLGAGHVIVSIDYRLAPETKLPGIVEDVRDAIAWVRARGPELFKIDPKRLAVVGHSAGGYLTLMAGFTVQPRPQALIAFYGYGDVDGDWYATPHEIYRRTRPLFTKEEAHVAIGTKETTNGGVKGRGNFYTWCRQNGRWPQEVTGYDPATQPREFDRFCPVRNVTKDYPPTLLLHGDNDIDVPHQQSVAMAAELARTGVAHEFISVPGGGHGFDGKGLKDPAVSAAFARIEGFLAKHTAGATANAATRRLPRDNLLLYRDADGRPAPVASVGDWAKRRAGIVRDMNAMMGGLPGAAKRCPLDVQVEEEVDCDTYVRRLVTYASEPGSRVPAYLLIPKDALAGKRRAPAVLCLHGTDNVVGHGTVVGLGTRPNRNYAQELAQRGYVAFAPNYPGLAKYKPDLDALGWEGGTAKAIWDNMRGLDLLASLPFVDRAAGFGAIGHSLGGHNAVFTAVFDERLTAVVSSCGLDSFLDYFKGDPKWWDPGKGWCQRYYMPRLAAYKGRLEEIPFDFHELIGALAPRHVLISAPVKDSNFHADSVDRIAAAARPIFRLHGHGDRLRVEHPEGGHDFPPAMREAAYRLFDQVLGKNQLPTNKR